MANREIGSIRTVIQQVADTSGEAMAAQIAQMGTKVIAQHQEALSNERFSDAQLQLQKMDTQYQKDWEHDPLNSEALNKYRTARKGVIDNLGKDISPFFKKPWEDSTRELAKKADIQLEMWGINQTRKNTVRAVNQSIKNNLSQATMDGQNWGKSEQTDAATLLNFAQSRERLAGYAGKHLGPNESSDLLESYGDDYLKSVISGVSETNPIKALKLMDDERIANGFKDKQQYLKMKDAVENRALKVDEINAQRQVLDALKSENQVLAKSLEKPMSYSELQQEFDKTDMSPAARSFFLKANGYTKADGSTKLSDAQKLEYKTELYDQLTTLAKNPEATTTDIKAFQDKIYDGMNRDALSQKEGLGFINQLVTPFADTKEKSFETFSTNTAGVLGAIGMGQDIGFKGVQSMFESDFAIVPPADEEAGPLTQSINNANKVKLYDYYMNSLRAGAESYGVAIGDVGRLNDNQRRKLFSEAQANARTLYLQDKHPALATLPDMPNQVLSGGTLTQGLVGPRKAPTDKAANKAFELQVGSDGILYRVYQDGLYEEVGPAPEGF